MLDFLGIGAQKAGTTWIYHWLSRHPDLAFPLGKEVHFWNRPSLRDLSWYWEHMRQSPQRVALHRQARCGEITPAYALLTATRIRLIHSLFPKLRLFFIIRHPVERAWSAALMALKRAELEVEEASDQWFIDHFHSAGSLGRSNYLRTIETWLSVFPPEQFRVLYHDQLLDEPREVLRTLSEHLDVDPSFYARFSDSEMTERVAPPTSATRHQLKPRPELQRYLTELYSPGIDALAEQIPLPAHWFRARRPGRSRSQPEPQADLDGSSESLSQRRTNSAEPRRIAVFVPVLNRGDLALASLTSLRRALTGLVADIYLFDNGSAPDTVAKLRLIDPGTPHRLAVIRLPENRGLPYAFNLFCRILEEPCDFARYSPPGLVMLADADVFYKRPVDDLVSVLLSDDGYGAVSGHDSLEHPSLASAQVSLNVSRVTVTEKFVERGQCLVLRRDDLLHCYPLPHHTNLDLDWQLLRHHPNSIASRGKKIVAVDATLHLGVFNSTWSPDALPASLSQLREVEAALARLGLQSYATSSSRTRSPPAPDAKHRVAPAPDPYLISRANDYPTLKPHQLLVLGMHRSGTSAVTGLLARLGVHVGASADLLAQDSANPVGYYERLDVLQLNQQLLARHAADAYQVGHLPLGGADRFRDPDLATKARQLIAKLDAHGLWIAKDPRFCITLPFWRRAGLNAMVAVIVVRDPVEVARSLEHRDRLTLPYALALWERYYVEALNNTIGVPRVVVSYNRLMQDAASTTEQLLTSLRRIGVRMPGSAANALLHLNTGLYRNHHSPKGQHDELLTSSQGSLYATLSQERIDNPDKRYRMSEIAAAILREYPVVCDLSEIEDEIRL